MYICQISRNCIATLFALVSYLKLCNEEAKKITCEGGGASHFQNNHLAPELLSFNLFYAFVCCCFFWKKLPMVVNSKNIDIYISAEAS